MGGIEPRCFLHVGQHLLPALQGGGADKAAQDLLYTSLELYRSHTRDAGDTLMMAYEAGHYTQVGPKTYDLPPTHHQPSVQLKELCTTDICVFFDISTG